MASWRKYFTTVPNQQQLTRKLEQMNKENGRAGTSHKFSSYLPEVYAGAPNRIERYVQYDQADLDSEINRALDTIAEFCTQNWDDRELVPFELIYNSDDLTETEIHLLNTSLNQWCRINKFNQRIFRIFRNCIKYGDQFFIRDPETLELLWVDATKVEKIVVNEAEGKAIESYVIRDLDFNMHSLTATNSMVQDNYSFPGGYPRSSNPAAGAGNINYGQPTTPGGRTSRFYNPANSVSVAAEHVVHLSLSEGMDQYWPFGVSVLEAVYKTYKQKDLLEDCILIYRIVRAPERRVFYIDVGQLQGQRAMAYVERVKNEIYQRRLPNRCLDLNTRIYLLDGRLLPLRDVIQEHEQGKTNWVYSCCPDTGKIVPGKITWAGATRSQTQVVRLTLDNGDQVTCTPDHKFPILGKGFVEAQHLEIGESFIPAYFRQSPVTQSKKPKNTYTQIFDPHTKKWRFVHRMVAEFFNDFEDAHPQVNRYQHARPGLSHYNMSQDMFQDLRAEYENLKKNIHYTKKHVGFKRLYPALQKNPQFVQAFKQANPDTTKSKFGPDLVLNLLKQQGFDTYEDFLNKEPYLNHKLVSIEWLDTPCDTGTITVDGDEVWHNYHTFAIEGGIFTKNSGGGTSITDTAYNPISITEDFFLATNTEQRGTRIESLAAGEQISQIDDLKYFTNKLMRGLGIPSSYLPTGPDDGTAIYNDGKVGTAFIQEYRFNKYCQRLQNSIIPMLDREFKLFLKHKGIEIPASQFNLQFNPPQSFSEYRSMALDQERINVFSSIMNTDAVKYLSKRYALERYLGWTQEDILTNERMWKEENADRVKDTTGASPLDQDQIGLRGIGVKPDMGMDDLGMSMDQLPPDQPAVGTSEPSPDLGGETAAPQPPTT
jgi:hypothetical protein